MTTAWQQTLSVNVILIIKNNVIEEQEMQTTPLLAGCIELLSWVRTGPSTVTERSRPYRHHL